MNISKRKTVFIVKDGNSKLYAEIIKVTASGQPTKPEYDRLREKYESPKTMITLSHFIQKSGDDIADYITL